MRWKMRNLAVATLLLVTANTVLAAGGRPRGVADRQQAYSDEQPETPSAVQCSSCLAHDQLKSLSIELIKDSILSKLGMKRPPEFGGRRPPKVPADLPPLKDLIHTYNDLSGSVVVRPHIRHKSHHSEASGDSSDMQSDEASRYATTKSPGTPYVDSSDDDDYHMKTHKLIAFAQPHPTTPKLRNHHLLYFTFSEKICQHRITKAILWVYKKRSTAELHQTEQVINIEVSRIHPVMMNQLLYVTNVKFVVNTTEPSWVSINLQKLMSDWFKTTDAAKNLTLMVRATYANVNMTHSKTSFVTDARRRDDMTEIPYLVVYMEEGRRSRAKRNVLGLDCNESSQESLCCRYPLTVDFDDFGWDWIIAPKQYVANYCSGECPMEFLQKYPHTHLTQLTNKTHMYPGTGPCCAPRKMSSISMLYYDENMNIIYGLLPGMIVDRCGCS
ncbi:growth/differentiation factor 8-like isoform X1 [Daktulosphaira vitifoliae]|uniref:growth/differentiation factor 8-like isoform X1 n=1 Tax=Daktulosphaira vitifoliae TaxID=58002 RepID=UPI0021AAB579|nr:growth/differentiation factor 8-like isoform X1 [Daktulosphaira vitifoliae]XP_050522739.1 growth/differentiation factor 8-like isoform X1 [Daktulosphaira vitifoliae]XP_050522740.1 growth/differentiation factor 8-like isoform X1 [Daktulosphaira vitifoliae]XP_050522741.1 growth/differentiation factor 8-like isoform X1 [Daktulosphaira vitifoliae]